MPLGYLIARSFITNPKGFEWRLPVVTRLIENCGGHCLVRTPSVEAVVGSATGFTLSVVEFPSVAALHRTVTSPEVKALHADFEAGLGQVDLWAAPGVEVPADTPSGTPPRGYLLARAAVSGLRRIQRPADLLSATVADAGGRILVRTGEIQLVASRVDVPWLTLIEMPSLPALKAALPVAGAPGTDALYKSYSVQDLWVAPGLE